LLFILMFLCLHRVLRGCTCLSATAMNTCWASVKVCVCVCVGVCVGLFACNRGWCGGTTGRLGIAHALLAAHRAAFGSCSCAPQ
jgi:hypothetical protein